LNLFGLSPGEILLIAMVAMIVLGPERLPEVAASAGKWIREFRRATEELTSQFADENPFTEIQKALALDELLAPTIITTAPPVQPAVPAVIEPIVQTPAPVVAPMIPQPTVPERIKSYHFFGTPNHPGLDPEWTYGVPVHHDTVTTYTPLAATDDEWLHGVPVLPEEPAAIVEDEILTQILSTAPVDDHAPDEVLDGFATNETTGPTSEELVHDGEPAGVASANGASLAGAEALSNSDSVVEVERDPVHSNGHGDEELLSGEPAPEPAHREPAFVGGEGSGRISEEQQP